MQSCSYASHEGTVGVELQLYLIFTLALNERG